ncbi:flagellar hook-length control protein FliK [Thiobacillus denitrificans]|uniref:flagellar hook-length control protein FliK n=1 Tax=Thiobacillus denitrificans TaxID=36861 RepID=UPI00075AE4C2|nr:flagellar hook-length control protein FliK [Thiobacillus denitrificans]
MSGVTPLIDTLLATRLAQRVDLVPLKGALEIAGPDAVARVEKVTNDVRLPSRAALQRKLGVGLHDGGDSRNNTAPSARSGETVTLSAVARAVSAILASQSDPIPKILGSKPLWPHLQPPAAQALTAALARTVEHSGLFYESHLRQYAAGTRTLAELAQEPQARLDATVKVVLVLPAAGAEGPDAGGGAPGNARGVEAAALPVAAPSGTGDAVPIDSGKASRAASLPNPLPASPEPAPSLAGSEGARFHAHEHAARADTAAPDASGKSHGASGSDAVRSNAPGLAGIHPEAIALVRQQLELLAAPVFRWGGEAWPGTPMDWEIREEQDERPAAADAEAVARTWSTRLALTLPTLRDVEVRISLAGSTLQVHLAARESATLALFDEGRHELPKRLGDLGLQLTGLQIGALPLNPAAQASPKDDDAP